VTQAKQDTITGDVLPVLLDIAQAILDRPVGPADNLFDLGGDSMQAVELMYTLEERFGAEFDPTAIIDAEDMAALAMLLHDQLRES